MASVASASASDSSVAAPSSKPKSLFLFTSLFDEGFDKSSGLVIRAQSRQQVAAWVLAALLGHLDDQRVSRMLRGMRYTAHGGHAEPVKKKKVNVNGGGAPMPLADHLWALRDLTPERLLEVIDDSHVDGDSFCQVFSFFVLSGRFGFDQCIF